MGKLFTNRQPEEVVENLLSVTHKSDQFDSEYLDPDVWKAFRNDSMLAFKAIYTSYADFLYNYGKKISDNEELVKDGLQDFFVELWNSRKNLAEVKSIKGYLLVGFRRKLIDKKKKLQRFQGISETDNFELIFSSHLESLEYNISEEKIQPLLKELNALPERQKEAIFLRFYNKLTCSEIGDILGVNAQSVYNLIHRALKILRNRLTPIVILSPSLLFDLLL